MRTLTWADTGLPVLDLSTQPWAAGFDWQPGWWFTSFDGSLVLWDRLWHCRWPPEGLFVRPVWPLPQAA